MDERNDDTAELIERLRLWLFEDTPTRPAVDTPGSVHEPPTTVRDRDAPSTGLDRGG